MKGGMSNVLEMQRPDPEQRYCSACGTAKACDCYAPYVSGRELAKRRMTQRPDLSDAQIAQDVGVSRKTANRARQELHGQNGQVETGARIGVDGKHRVLPKPREPDPPDEDFLNSREADEAIIMIAKRVNCGLLQPSPGILACLTKAMARSSAKDREAIAMAAETLSHLTRKST